MQEITNILPTPHVSVSRVICFRTRRDYGVERMYITSAPHLASITRLTGRKSMDDADKKALEDLGFTFRRVF